MSETPCNVTAGCEPCTLPSESGCNYVKCTKETRNQVRVYDHLHTVEEHILHQPKCKIQYVAVHHQAPCQKVVVGCPCVCPESQDGFVRESCNRPCGAVPVVAAAPAVATAEVQVSGAGAAHISAEAIAAAAAPQQQFVAASAPVTQFISAAPAVPAVQYITVPAPQQQYVAAPAASPKVVQVASNPSTGFGYRFVPAGM